MVGILGGILIFFMTVRNVQAWVGTTGSYSFGLGTCTFFMIAQANPNAYIRVKSGGVDYYVKGTTLTLGGLNTSASTPITDAKLADCGLSNVQNFNQAFLGSDYASMKEVSLSFIAVINNGVSGSSDGGTVIGDGSTAYKFSYTIIGDVGSTPTFSRTIVKYTAPSTTASKVASFITARADRIVGGQPDYLERLTGNRANNENNPLGLNGNGDVGSGFAYVNASFGTNLGGFGYLGSNSNDNLDGRVGTYSSWASGSYSYVENGNSKSNIGLVHLGTDYRLSEDKLVGFVAEFDFIDENNGTDSTSANGWGWMAGPYIAARIQKNLYFDAVANYGQSYNNMQAIAGVNGDFKTERFLLSAKLTGELRVQNNIIINPFAKISYFNETQNSYTDNANNVIASKTYTLGQFEFGPKVSTTIDLDEYRFDPFISFSGVWDFDSIATSTSTDNIRGVIKSGFIIAGDDNIRLNFEGFYDGIGAANFQAYGGTVGLSINF